jgi:hypothetical protein
MLKSTKHKIFWVIFFVLPPIGYLFYMIIDASPNYDGHCSNFMEIGQECSFFQYILSYITHPFIMPAYILITLYWLSFAGLIYFAVKWVRMFIDKRRLKT